MSSISPISLEGAVSPINNERDSDRSLKVMWDRITPSIEQTGSLKPLPTEVNEIRQWIQDDANQEILKSVENLDLSFLNLTVIPVEIKYLTALKELNLSNNNIECLNQLEQLKLSSLNLSSNKIKDITSFAYIGNLTLNWLDLSKNQIEAVWPLGGCPSLSYLNLSNNAISKVDELSLLTDLTHLNLSENSIKTIDPFNTLINLTHLYLYFNQIEEIASLGNLENLIELDLLNNQISNIDIVINFRKLTLLNLTSNNITNIEPLIALDSLKWLGLGYNRVADLSSLENLKNLASLYVVRNPIDKNLAIQKFERLTWLDIRDDKERLWL